MPAYYNAPDNAADLVASFHTRDEAEAYADRFGGEVEAVGVVFTVGRGADHEKAKQIAHDHGDWYADGGDDLPVADEVEGIAGGDTDPDAPVDPNA